MGERRPDVGVGHGGRVRRDRVRVLERFDPVHPVLAAHHLHGGLDLLGGGGGQGDLRDFVGAQVDGLVGVGRAGRLEHRRIDGAVGHGAARRGQGVHHQIHTAEVALDGLDGFLLYFPGKGVAVDRLGVQAVARGELLERGGVVPARAAGAAARTGLVEDHAEGGGPRAVGQCDARGQAVARRRADHQHLFRSFDTRAAAGNFNLPPHLLAASGRVRGGADKSTDFRFHYHVGCPPHQVKIAEA